MLPPLPSNRGGKRPARRGPNRFAEVNGFVDFTLAGLSRAEVAVRLILWRDTKPSGTTATLQADLGRRAGCDPRTVRRAIRALRSAGC